MNYKIQKEFTHDGEKYQIRSWVKDEEIWVHAFKQDGTRVDHPAYSVSEENQRDAEKTQSFFDPLEELVQIAERHVREEDVGEVRP